MVQSSADQIIDVIAVRHGFVPAPRAMLVSALIFGRALSRVSRAHSEGVLIHMIPMHVMKMSVMQIIRMAGMADGRVTTIGAMVVCVIRVMLLRADVHGFASFRHAAPVQSVVWTLDKLGWCSIPVRLSMRTSGVIQT
jgi:hypothetical protein